jgi:chemosensory pili system protein ChpA (sensor histidine kinase/response regulator)
LNGTAKTAGARQGIKIATPLNRYIRKLYDNSRPLPAAGLEALKDAVRAIDDIVRHIDEDTGYFQQQLTLTARLAELEQALDASIAEQTQMELRRAEEASGMPETLVEEESLVPELSEVLEPLPQAIDPFAASEDDPDVIELPATDARELDTFTLRALREQMAAQLGTESDDAPSAPIGQEAYSDEPVLSDAEALSTLMQPLEEGPVEIVDIELSSEVQEDDSPTDVALEEPSASQTTFASDAEVEIDVGEAEGPVALSDDAGFVPELSEADVHVAEVAPSTGPAETATEQVDSVLQRAEATPTLSETVEPVDVPIAAERPSAPPEPVAVTPISAPPVVEESAPQPVAEEDEQEDFDPDVAAIFTEEATELLEAADQALSAWMRDKGNQSLVFELKRSLHTLKGGARMAGLRAMGDLSHELESFMQGVESGMTPAEPHVFEALQASLDELHSMRDLVASGGRCRPAKALIARIRAIARGETPPAAEVAAPAQAPEPVAEVSQSPIAEEPQAAPVVEAVIESAAVEPAPSVPPSIESQEVESVAQDSVVGEPVAEASTEAAQDEDDAREQMPVALPPGREPQQQQERQEFARVDADLLDSLLNNAGEVSIFRSRLEQQVSSIEYNLQELSRTVTRLKDQLRKLELETEAQILHKHQEESALRADFDPLELDRYSTIQQLSRALAESVADVGSIEGLLENLTREAQNLLLQQSRVVTELQGGLMRTRMVPFQRHVQRLSRLVRQVAADEGKRAELVVEGASGELDRQVLERMLPPFEHMLRNSVVHGIETPEERVAKGKPEHGTIKVGLHREGSEVVIVIEDDGRGIDVNAVRQRALQRGLVQPGTVLTDEEALQLVLEPGFSTATTVTQHAGRGVGMDVVVNEIKKLGGVLFTESKPDQGVKFTIRLPFTLAITQALIVRVGEELYALPLPSVEGVARVPREEVQRHLSEETPTFSYGGQIYRFQHLGYFIGAGPSTLPDSDTPVPVVLVRAGEHSTALVTDELVGSREMVVKSVGPQIATIRGIAGATILGDGRIVIILDMGALVRSEWRSRGPVQAQPMQERKKLALVVDDSITVRRVTQRLLERNGMRVMTAKDGVDAWTLLQDHVPDVILLDIEMPRMDGYELAAHVRSDARLSGVPIVMITSRVGEKHRARAIELGVNDYLGKPYQEHQLLDAIEPLVNARTSPEAQAAG